MRSLLVLAALVSNVVMAAEVSVDDCIIQEVLPGKQMTGAFATFENASTQPAILKRVTLDGISNHVELHAMTHKDGVMQMEKLPQYTLPEGKTVFRKGGYHIMVMDIEKAPAVGSHYKMTFTFGDGSQTTCMAEVKSIADVMQRFDTKASHGHEAMMHDDSEMATHGEHIHHEKHQH